MAVDVPLICVPYTNTLKAEFSRPISAEAFNEQFEDIERALACLEQLVATVAIDEFTVYDNGVITDTVELKSSNGNMQYAAPSGDVNVSFEAPGAADPRIVHLVLRDAGAGLVNFPTGAAWATGSNIAGGSTSSGIDVKPYSPLTMGNLYGAVVTCIYDGRGWMCLTHGRNDVNFSGNPATEDIYTWR